MRRQIAPDFVARKVAMGLFSLSTGKRRAPLDDPVNIASPEFKANPYPFYARLRASRRSPV